MGSFIKTRHDTIFQKHLTTLMSDIGRSVSVYLDSGSPPECSWCYYDSKTGRSSGRPKAGKVWSTHANYKTSLTCPECNGVGKLNTMYVQTVNNVIIQDVSGEQIERGKSSYFKNGTKRIIGHLEDILTVSGTSPDWDSETIFQRANKLVIDGQDVRLVSLNRIGLKTRYLFDALVENMDVIQN